MNPTAQHLQILGYEMISIRFTAALSWGIKVMEIASKILVIMENKSEMGRRRCRRKIRRKREMMGEKG